MCQTQVSLFGSGWLTTGLSADCLIIAKVYKVGSLICSDQKTQKNVYPKLFIIRHFS